MPHDPLEVEGLFLFEAALQRRWHRMQLLDEGFRGIRGVGVPAYRKPGLDAFEEGDGVDFFEVRRNTRGEPAERGHAFAGARTVDMRRLPGDDMRHVQGDTRFFAFYIAPFQNQLRVHYLLHDKLAADSLSRGPPWTPRICRCKT